MWKRPTCPKVERQLSRELDQRSARSQAKSSSVTTHASACCTWTSATATDDVTAGAAAPEPGRLLDVGVRRGNLERRLVFDRGDAWQSV